MIKVNSDYSFEEILDYCEITLDNMELLHESILMELLDLWINLIKKQRIIVDIPSNKSLVVGDLHGDYESASVAMNKLKSGKVNTLIFNGDIIDRGPNMLKCIIYIIIYQIKYPKNIFVLRGNHEIQSINEFYGFKDLCIKYFNLDVYNKFNHAFEQLPLCAKFSNSIFITHGGIPIEPIYFHLMRLELKPKEPLNHQLYGQLLWNDPNEEIKGFSKSRRGKKIYYFGREIVEQFLELHNMKLIIRAHEPFIKGYNWSFDNKLLTIFSSNKGPYKEVIPHFALIENDKTRVIPVY